MVLTIDSCQEHISEALTFKEEPIFFSCMFDPMFSVLFLSAQVWCYFLQSYARFVACTFIFLGKN